MAWRNLLIQNPARLSLYKSQICIENDDGKATLPLEDITTVILETPQAILSSALLSAFQEYNVVVVTCDAYHTPNGIVLPFHQHSRITKIAHRQHSWGLPLKKRVWQQIIKQKIINQGICLKQQDISGYERLLSMADKVKSGDTGNIEAQAARYYWKKLFGDDFIRGREDIVNHGLNYGYAVMRATVARSIVSYGLIPSFGLHHNNDLNAFNLADDIIESFRPFVDAAVKNMTFDNDAKQLDKEQRQFLANIPNTRCLIANEVQTLINATDKVASDIAGISPSSPTISLPTFYSENNECETG